MDVYFKKNIKPTFLAFVVSYACFFIVFSLFFFGIYKLGAGFCGSLKSDCGSVSAFIVGIMRFSLYPSIFISVVVLIITSIKNDSKLGTIFDKKV